MIEINVSAGKPYFTQRNNKIRPFITCNSTSMIAALSYRGVTFPVDPVYTQPEDSLTNFLLTDPRIDDLYKETNPYEYKKYIAANKDPKFSIPPNQIHALLSYGTNLWLGKQPNEVTSFKTDLSLQVVVYEFVKGKPVVQGGLWNNLRHITCMVGVATSQDDIQQIDSVSGIDVSKIDHLIMDDSYGDFRSGYKIQTGNDIRILPSEYHDLVTVQGKDIKYGHIFFV